jgi:aminopeptidase N
LGLGATRRLPVRTLPVLLVLAVLCGCAHSASSTASAGGRFGGGQAVFHPTVFAPYRFDDTIVRLHFDFPRGILYGDETAIVRAKRSGLRQLPFNTLGIHYRRITVNGRPADFAFDRSQQLVNVQLGSPVAAGTRLSVRFRYWAAPQAGVYFIRPDAHYPGVTPEIWSQGETTDNRRWFPTWDEPNQKTPSELIVTVPHGWSVVANGYLKARVRSAGGETWDWNSPHPKSTYLIAFAAGPLSEHHTRLGRLNVDSFVQPPDAALNALCFGRTSRMIAYYQHVIGAPYPFAKYDQITAERFTYGGMENASATIVTTHALHPAVSDVEQSCDGLVSHELAQQWFGDDVTMSDWSNEWINEGFATYFDELWTGHRFGRAAFEYARYRAQRAYFAETKQYFRPIVDYVYAEPLDLFDASGHERAAAALHMLRYMFGDARFFAALHAYLREYQYRNASTAQFFASIGKTLGTDLTWFKDEWFYRASYPHYFVTDAYDPAAKTLTLHVEQRNRDGKPYRMPIAIEAFVGGSRLRIEPLIDRNAQVVTMQGVSAAPQMILFDPNGNVLAQLTFEQPVARLAYQLAYAPHVGDREWALHQLAAFAHAGRAKRAAAMQAVARAVASDPFYGLRADAAAVAATFGDAASVLGALKDPDVRVRLAAERSAAALPGRPAAVVSELRAMLDDSDPNVVAAAYASLGALKAPDAYDALVAGLQRPSFRQTIASGALRGLAAFGDRKAWSLIAARTAYGTPVGERNSAILASAQLAVRVGQQAKAMPLLLRLVTDDPLIATRMTAADALSALGRKAAIPTLERVERRDPQILVRIEARSAVAHIERVAHAGS